MSYSQAITDIFGNEIYRNPENENFISVYGGIMKGPIDMNQHPIIDVPDPVSSTDVCKRSSCRILA